MVGIVYQVSGKIIFIVEEVLSYTETDIVGEHATVRGIDPTQACFCIVESTELKVGETVGDFTDTRDQLPKTDQLRISQLQTEKAVLEAQVTQLNGDLAGFIDFYFANNPEQV